MLENSFFQPKYWQQFHNALQTKTAKTKAVFERFFLTNSPME